MRWLRQVAHVAAKDARRMRWQALGYAGLVVLAALQVGRGQLQAIWSLAALVTVLVALAQVVQDDPAIRDDAFWVSRPLSPGAVFAAKLVMIVVAVAIAIVGQTVLLARYQMVGGALLRSLGEAVPTWLAFVTGAVVLAAITRDSRGFVIAFTGALAVWALTGALLEDRIKELFTRPEWVTPLLVLVGSLAIAGYQYLSGRRLRAVGLFVGLVLASAVLGWAPGPRRGRHAASAGPVLPAALRPDSILVRAGTPDQPGAGALGFRAVGGSADLEYVLAEGSLKLRAPDGLVTETRVGRHKLSAGLPVLAELPGVRWVGNAYEPGWMAWGLEDEFRGLMDNVRREPTPSQRAPASVSGRVEGWEPHVGARLPLRVGASVTLSGRGVVVRAVARDQRLPDVLPPAAGIRVELEVSRVNGAGSGFFDGPGPVKFAILDRVQRVALPLEVISSGGSSGGTFLLPQPAATFTYRLLWTRRADAPAVLSDSLELLALDWRLRGSYPVTLLVERAR